MAVAEELAKSKTESKRLFFSWLQGGGRDEFLALGRFNKRSLKAKERGIRRTTNVASGEDFHTRVRESNFLFDPWRFSLPLPAINFVSDSGKERERGDGQRFFRKLYQVIREPWESSLNFPRNFVYRWFVFSLLEFGSPWSPICFNICWFIPDIQDSANKWNCVV